MEIRKDYPGGNIKVNRIEGDAVYLEQELRDTGEWWFYWNFCACGMQGRKIRFVFENGEVLGSHGPCKSTDRIDWTWAGAETLRGLDCFEYTFSETETEVYFAFSIPYQLADLERFIKKNRLERNVSALAVSEKGRSVPVLRIGNANSDKHIYFTARHHACESTASYVLEGVMDALLNGKSGLAGKYLFHVVPFVDLDGAEEGDQGKSRIPHDHYCDYSEKPIYNAVRELCSYTEKFPPYLYIDFHSPWKWGDDIYMVNSPEPGGALEDHLGELWKEQIGKEAGTSREAAVTYDPRHNLKYGRGFNIDGPDAPLSANYFRKRGAMLSVVIEFPYFGGEVVYTQKNLRTLGGRLIRATEQLLAENEEDANGK